MPVIRNLSENFDEIHIELNSNFECQLLNSNLFWCLVLCRVSFTNLSNTKEKGGQGHFLAHKYVNLPSFFLLLQTLKVHYLHSAWRYQGVTEMLFDHNFFKIISASGL